uniref:Ras-related protein Rab-10-like n=1 Tax=Phallusia mammillata TaxID=59560 RepID=A0A6F9DPH5_9ASCI|nr:ras-related protein Rab-10-like [Phallusia mammillata]
MLQKMDKDYDVLFRIMILGDTGVGKTCLLHRFCDEEFRYNHVCTIGIDFKMKTININGVRVRIQIWDTAGQERYRTITRQYYRKGQGIILTYDITNEASFLNIRKWTSDVSEYGDEKVQTILVGNKSDREDGRAVSTEEGAKLADEFGMSFLEASAYTDSNVTEVFTEMARCVLEANKEEFLNTNHKTLHLSSSSEDENSEDEGIVKDLNADRNKPKFFAGQDLKPASCCTT